MDLPIYSDNAELGEIGETIVKEIVQTQLKWRFRKNHLEDDFGIDAFIDIINASKQLTGKYINLQIKTGESYFVEKDVRGWIYRGERKHLNYYLNHDSPVIILLVDDKLRKVFWCLCDKKKIELTSKNWKIVVPFTQILQASSKAELEKHISPVVDYASQLEYYWKLFTEHERIVFNIKKPIIQKLQFSNIVDAFQKMAMNEKLLEHCKNKIDIWIDDYNFDDRELFQIPETKKWVNKLSKKIEGWSYFLAKDVETAAFLKVMQLCQSSYRNVDGTIIFDQKDLNNFLIKSYEDLNKFSQKHEIAENVVAELSKQIDVFLNRKYQAQE
jgi:hypothetical protein